VRKSLRSLPRKKVGYFSERRCLDLNRKFQRHVLRFLYVFILSTYIAGFASI
jgi:hypothetical protein